MANLRRLDRKHKIQEASPRVSNRSSLRREELQIKFAAAILVEFFFFCGPAGSLSGALAAPARPVFGSRFTCLTLGIATLISRLSSIRLRWSPTLTCVPCHAFRVRSAVRAARFDYWSAGPPSGNRPAVRRLCPRPGPCASVDFRSVGSGEAHGPSVLVSNGRPVSP
jgi:hypothetical protein